MKTLLVILFVFVINFCFAQASSGSKTDSTRIVFSSGGSSGNQLASVSVGETFAGSFGNSNLGSQQFTTFKDTGVNSFNITLMDINRVLIYPNPAGNTLSVEVIGSYYNEYSLILNDLLGKELLKKQQLKELEVIDIEMLNPGNYFISIYNKTGNRIFIEKLIKK